MTDAETILAFALRERQWLAVLATSRTMHASVLGKTMTSVQWLPDGARGSCGWLGYYWEVPAFWFGFGLQREMWLPLIECDIRRCDSEFMLLLESHLPATWRTVDRIGGNFWRLWAPASCDGNATAQADWLAERSRELHEFSVTG